MQLYTVIFQLRYPDSVESEKLTNALSWSTGSTVYNTQHNHLSRRKVDRMRKFHFNVRLWRFLYDFLRFILIWLVSRFTSHKHTQTQEFNEKYCSYSYLNEWKLSFEASDWSGYRDTRANTKERNISVMMAMINHYSHGNMSFNAQWAS